MNKIKIMTDSACDIPVEIEKELDIKIMCFPVTVGDVGYTERVDFTPTEFYDVLCSTPKIPTTSQIIPIVFLEEFVNICKQGYQELIYVSICGKGSSTHNNAVIAKNEFYEKYPQYSDFKIHIIDSKTYCLAYGYPVMEAAKKANRNATSDEIIAYLNDWFDSALVFLAPYTLEFAKKSGRIGCAAAFMGELIGLRPIILMVDGTTKTIAKVRGDKNVVPELVKLAKEHAVPETPYVVIETMLKEESKDLQASMKKAFGYDCVGVYQAGAAISINAGPKIVAVVVKGQNRKSNQ